MALTLLLRAIQSLPNRPDFIATRPPDRIDTIWWRVPLHQAMALGEARKMLRERDRIPPELPQAGARHSHEIDLHVLERHQHRLYHRGPIEEILQILKRLKQT